VVVEGEGSDSQRTGEMGSMNRKAWAGAFKRENIILIHPYVQDRSGKLYGTKPCLVLEPSTSMGKIGKTVIKALNQTDSVPSGPVNVESFRLTLCEALGVKSQAELMAGTQFVELFLSHEEISMTPTRATSDDFQKLLEQNVSIGGFANHKSIGEAVVRAWSLCQ
jgi:hypothetical protein